MIERQAPPCPAQVLDETCNALRDQAECLVALASTYYYCDPAGPSGSFDPYCCLHTGGGKAVWRGETVQAPRVSQFSLCDVSLIARSHFGFLLFDLHGHTPQ